MIQPIHEIEEHYLKPDPWGYQTHPDDLLRKKMILQACKAFVPYAWNEYTCALDLGAGEGWITQDLPAMERYGYELSAQAKARFPQNVKPCNDPSGTYDLVTACGVLYPHYDVQKFFQLMKLASRIIVTCNIEAWEVSEMSDPHFTNGELGLIMMMEQRFRYREYFQKLRVFKVK